MTEETIPMKAIVVTDQAAGTAEMTLVERPEPQAAINDVVVQVHASGFTSGELTWPSTWTDRLDRDRTPSIPGQELAGVVTALGYGTTGLSVGQRVFGLSDSYRGGTLAEYAAVEARNLAPLPGDVDFTVGASVAMPGLTAWQGLFEHGRLQAGQSILVHGAAGAVGSNVGPTLRTTIASCRRPKLFTEVETRLRTPLVHDRYLLIAFSHSRSAKVKDFGAGPLRWWGVRRGGRPKACQ